MCDIEWNKLYEATSKENRPTPGYVFNDIVQNVSYADPRHIPSVAEYLTDCVDGDHAHVKLKALFVIKALAYRVPPFCNCMRERLASVQEAAAFSGPPSALYGEEPYRLVREAAESALTALTGGEHYHEQYREMSQRIVGFGNFQPGDDTVLPDGSVNVGRDIGVKEVAMGAVGLIGTGVGALLGGVKDLFYSPFNQKKGGLGALGTEEEEGDPDGGYDDNEDIQEDDEPQGSTDEAGCYHPSAGSYVPPTVPIAPPLPEEPALEGRRELETMEDLFDDDEPAYWPAEATLTAGGLEKQPPTAAPQEEASFMDVLGLGSDDGCGCPGVEPIGLPAPSPSEALDPSEAEILDMLGITSGRGAATGSAPGEPSASAPGGSCGAEVGAACGAGAPLSAAAALGQPSAGTLAAGLSAEVPLQTGAPSAIADPAPLAVVAATCSGQVPERPPSSLPPPSIQPAPLAGHGFLEV